MVKVFANPHELTLVSIGPNILQNIMVCAILGANFGIINANNKILLGANDRKTTR